MDGDTGRIDLEALVSLCRYYCLAERALPSSLVLQDRAVALAELGYRHAHPEHAVPVRDLGSRLRRAWADGRIRALEPRRRQLLCFVTGAALGQLEQRPAEARALLARALAVSRLTWTSSRWEPWEGARPEVLQRRAVDVLPGLDRDSGDAPDASGDPVELPLPHTIEGPVVPSDRLAEFAHVSQVLDGLNHWEAVLQEHLELPIGTFATTGRPDVEGLLGDTWPDRLPEPVRAAYLSNVA